MLYSCKRRISPGTEMTPVNSTSSFDRELISLTTGGKEEILNDSIFSNRVSLVIAQKLQIQVFGKQVINEEN